MRGASLTGSGQRKTGKTTLVYRLATEYSAAYGNDDCIIKCFQLYWGFGMPLPIRRGSGISNNPYSLLCSADTDGENREITELPNIMDRTNSIDVILFPRYNSDGINRIAEIKRSDVFQKLLLNTRAYSDMRGLLYDIKQLSDGAISYSIEYSDYKNAFRMLKEKAII